MFPDSEGLMASENVIHLTDANFDATVNASATPVLVDFWASWCGPCLRLGPTVDALAAELGGKLTVAKVNVDENPVVPGRFGVRSIPTLILFKGGKPVDTSIGLVSKSELAQMVSRHLA
jgi:thioredoxin 1